MCEVYSQSDCNSLQVLNSSRLEKELTLFLLGYLSLKWTFKTEAAVKPIHWGVHTNPSDVESSGFVRRQTALASHLPLTAYKLFNSEYISLSFSFLT